VTRINEGDDADAVVDALVVVRVVNVKSPK
jgi:hypothetical protein